METQFYEHQMKLRKYGVTRAEDAAKDENKIRFLA